MARNVLFLVHGSGLQGEDWADREGGAAATLRHAAQGFELFRGKRLDDFVELVPVRYDDVFERILGRWSDYAQKIRDNAGGGSQEILNLAVNLTAEAGEDREGFLAQGGDLLLYKGIRLFARRVQLRVAAHLAGKIAERTASADGQPPRFSIAAEGLGTAVVHDTLHLLGSGAPGLNEPFSEDERAATSEQAELLRATQAAGRPNPFGPAVFRFDSLFMINNLSGLLHTIPEGITRSIVRPPVDRDPQAYVRHYYSFAHLHSPLAQVGAFRMPETWKKAAIGFEVHDLDHFHARDIRTFGHSLLHPKVHLPILANTVDAFDPGGAGLRVVTAFPRTGAGLAGREGQRVEEAWKRLAEKAAGKTSLPDAVWFAGRAEALARGMAGS